MNRIFPICLLLFTTLLHVMGATVKISDLPIITSPSTNTFIELADMNEATKSRKYLLTNLATVSYVNSVTNQGLISGLVSNNVASAGLLAVDSTKTNGIAATAAMITNLVNSQYVLKSGDTMTGALRGIDGTAANPTFSFGNSTNTGIYIAAAGDMRFSAAGTGVLKLDNSAIQPFKTVDLLNSNCRYGWINDTGFYLDAANTLAQRNGANAQTFRVYNTYTDASNYERANMYWNANAFVISTEKGGTGSGRDLYVNALGALHLGSVGASKWYLQNPGGHLLAEADNTYDIGASGANRPRNIYAGSDIFAYGNLRMANKYQLGSALDGTIVMFNNAATDFNRLQFGGTTASFPSIKRNSTALESRLADDSNYAPLNAPWQQSGYTKVCTSAVSNALFYVSVPNTNMIGGRVLYSVNATDGTDAQQITGTLQFGAVGKSTAVTANVTDVQNTSTVSAGTLTATLTANVSTNNVFALMVTPTTSLTTTNLTVKWRLETPSTYSITPL